ncbi:MAG: RNA polymerase sigma factor [Bacteroidia bacterium]
MEPAGDVHELAAKLFREHSGKLTGVLVRSFGIDALELLQDAVQDTFETALNNWQKHGVPDTPEAWLMRVARNKALNALQRSKKQTRLNTSVFAGSTAADEQSEQLLPGQIADSELRLLFACVQLDFPVRNRVMLALHLMCGLGVSELAAALFMQPEAVKKALFRMKAELRAKPGLLETAWPMLSVQRVKDVQLVLYLMFNEGCKTTRSNVIINHELCFGAMRLNKLLCERTTAAHEESCGLMALMFFALSRFPARLDAAGAIVPLAAQDRSKWDARYITEGYNWLSKAKGSGRFYLEALISSVHCAAADFGSTNWNSIVFLYRQLQLVNASPAVNLNLLLARSYAETPAAVLPELSQLRQDAAEQNISLMLAAEADMLERAGKKTEARNAFIAAANATTSAAEKQLYLRRAAQCA